MNKKKTILSLLFPIVLFSFFAFAQNENSWDKDKKYLEIAVNNHECEKYWDILWPWAKKGNYEAREYLLSLLLPLPHMDQIYPPGNAGDTVSVLRDAAIMSVHAGSIKDKEYAETVKEIYKIFHFNQSAGGKKFLACLDTDEDCASIAVAEKLVPSFEEYALQVDAFVVQGIEDTCHRNK